MKKMILSMWLLMLSMVATAQTFVVVDKNGNRTTYDVSKLDSVTFQQTPPGLRFMTTLKLPPIHQRGKRTQIQVRAVKNPSQPLRPIPSTRCRPSRATPTSCSPTRILSMWAVRLNFSGSS